MQAVRFSILRWSAWAPGLTSADQWSAWAHGHSAPAAATTAASAPVVDFLPAMLRRRLSDLSKAALWAAFQCAAPQQPDGHRGRTVFASPHGEIHRTKTLLDDLARGEPLSPNAFSLSVHNTASGLYAIAGEQRAASTAIAAGVDTLEMAMIEAAGALRRGAERVMVVFADEPLPEFYRHWAEPGAARFALALLLGPETAGPAWQLSLERGGAAPAATEPHGLSVLRLLTGAQRTLALRGARAGWAWERP
jgi:Beta-ketoacyl synthase, N-terminal domain